MTIHTQKQTRLEQIIEKLLKHKDLIEAVDKGAIEINFSGTASTVQIKVVVQ